MRVEADDPQEDWTREGVFEVDPGVYRIPLPLPHDGLRAVNVYAIAGDDDGMVLVDAGWNLAVARAALEKALGALDRGLGDIRRFLVTHAHRDHYGQAVVLRRELGAAVALGEGERPTLELLGNPDHRPLSEFEGTLYRAGAHALLVWLRSLGDAKHEPNEWPLPDDWLRGGDRVAVSARTLTVVETPGHTRGHVVYVDEAAGLLLAGDHVLPHITPSIGFEPVPLELVLGRYLDSLRVVREMPDRRLLPAHGPIGPSVHGRVDELLDHHSRRLDECLAALGADELTAFECAQRLTWTRRRRSFTELDEFNQMLAVGETGAHLDLAVAQGRATATEPEGVRRYAAA